MPFYMNSSNILVEPQLAGGYGDRTYSGKCLQRWGNGERSSPYYYVGTQLNTISLVDITTGSAYDLRYTKISGPSWLKDHYSGYINFYTNGNTSSSSGSQTGYTYFSTNTNYRYIYAGAAGSSCVGTSHLATLKIFWGHYHQNDDASCMDRSTQSTTVCPSTSNWDSDWKSYGGYKTATICNNCDNGNICGTSSSNTCSNCISGTNVAICSCCLSKDTLLELANGDLKKISNIEIGDIIYSLNNKEHVPSKVTAIYVAFPNKDTKIYTIMDNEGHKLEITGMHPIACDGNIYKTIEKTEKFDVLSVGDKLITGNFVASITSKTATDVVYNLRTEYDDYLVQGFVIACEDIETKYIDVRIKNKIGAAVKIKNRCNNDVAQAWY